VISFIVVYPDEYGITYETFLDKDIALAWAEKQPEPYVIVETDDSRFFASHEIRDPAVIAENDRWLDEWDYDLRTCEG
jgi:hypothetical protein